MNVEYKINKYKYKLKNSKNEKNKELYKKKIELYKKFKGGNGENDNFEKILKYHLIKEILNSDIQNGGANGDNTNNNDKKRTWSETQNEDEINDNLVKVFDNKSESKKRKFNTVSQSLDIKKDLPPINYLINIKKFDDDDEKMISYIFKNNNDNSEIYNEMAKENNYDDEFLQKLKILIKNTFIKTILKNYKKNNSLININEDEKELFIKIILEKYNKNNKDEIIKEFNNIKNKMSEFYDNHKDEINIQIRLYVTNENKFNELDDSKKKTIKILEILKDDINDLSKEFKKNDENDMEIDDND